MTYSVGGLIQASDYNTFQGSLNNIWSTGSGDSGWGQTALPQVSQYGVVTATNWASLVNTIKSAGGYTGTTLTSRTAPVTGNVIAILANVATDITSCTTNRGNSVGTQSQQSTWTGSAAKTTSTGTGVIGWTITWTQTFTFASAAQARYFWNAGGGVNLQMNKSSTGTDIDPDWNTFIATVGTLCMVGRVNNANQTINGVVYTGFGRRFAGSGTPAPNLSTTGWYTLTPGAAQTTLWQLNQTTYPYTADYVRVTAAVNSGSTALTLITTWSQSTQSYSTVISGGTDTPSGGPFGTAPAIIPSVTYPNTAYLANTWGSVSVTSTVS